MKRINLFLILILFMVLSQSSAVSMDFYPELGADPFYSSLNPTYTDKAEEKDNFSVINMFKNKRNANKTKKELDKQNKLSEIAQKKDSENVTDSTKKSFIIFKKNNADEQQKEETIKPKKRPTVRELEADERAREKEREIAEHGKKTLKQKFMSIFPQKTPTHEDVPENPKIELSADHMEYYPDRYEVEAIGNAKMVFTRDNTKLIANKIVFNYDKNILQANENVFLMTKDTITEGDFIRIDLSKPSGWIDTPITTTDAVKLTAKEAYLYSDRVEEYDGVAKILKNEVLALRAESFGSYVDQSGVLSSRNNYGQMKPTSGVYSLKAKTIYIDSKQDHDVITVKNADVYLRNHKVATIPSARVVTNKNNTVIESNIPEVGSQSMLGMHIGPAVVLNIPGGSTLKLAPILTYGNSRLGFGGIARFRNEYNMTEVAYGTSEEQLLIRGRQKILPGLTLNYSRFTNESEWFLGYRRPKYAASLNYSRSDYVKDLRLTFSQEYSAGAFLDDREGIRARDTEGRFRWMTQTYKPMYSYENTEGSVSIKAGLVAQTAASVYTSGDVYGLLRFGPALSTNVGPWKQSVIYYMSAIAGKTPFDFDRYRYGRSNVVVIESLRLCKYLSVGYLASLAMNRDEHDDGLFQENRVLLSVGPDYMKLTFGYDVYRHNTSLLLSMLVGSKDSEVAFKKTVIKNPETFGRTNTKKEKPKKKNYKRFLKEKITPDTVL